MSTTSIEWATHVLNAFTGCDRVSPGCAHCYAADVAAGNQRRELGRARVALAAGRPAPKMRYQNDGDPKSSGPGFGFTVHWDKLLNPPKFPAGARVFVNSMSDVFHEKAPAAAIAQLFALFADRPDVDWLVLTKRPERMRALMLSGAFVAAVSERIKPVHWTTRPVWPLPNVWLGVSIENRHFIHRAQVLRETPAAVRFISAEPLLGPLVPKIAGTFNEPIAWWPDGRDTPCVPYDGLDLFEIDWLIVGGESGAGARRVDHEWVRDLRDIATTVGTPFFFKQWGGRTSKSGGRELDGHRWDELPSTGRARPGDQLPHPAGRNGADAPEQPRASAASGSGPSCARALPPSGRAA